tara:strand:+ start:17480 stop:19069 length:1590 start_codon:yes stop_codon:yes gene_type:complete
MPAVVTDQFRIVNASNFVDSVLDSNNSYYVFLGLPNPAIAGFGRTTTWNDSSGTPDPIDNQKYLTHYRNTSLFGKKINTSNIRRVVKKHSWTANTRYDMYRHDYSVNNLTPNSKTGSLYRSNYYVITSEFKVYICLDNGGSGTPDSTDSIGEQSKDEPTFTDLEPAAAGVQDNYTWKYLFTVSPSDVVKFDSTEYIVLPNDWSTSTDAQIQAVREAGDSDINKNQIKKVFIKNGGSGYDGNQTGSRTVDIIGDGVGAKALVSYTSGVITDVIVTAGGSGYTFAMVDLSNLAFNTSGTRANLIPIIPPSKGHGFNIYDELGADKVLVYSRFDDSTKDFPTDTHFAQVGIIKNPSKYDVVGISTGSQFSSLSSIRLSSGITGVTDYSTLIGVGITQSVTDGVARGTVASYDQDTFVLKYIQDRSLNLNQTSYDTTDYANMNSRAKLLPFESSSESVIGSGALSFTKNINTNFSGITTVVGNKQINLGVEFTNGLANPEINKKTGDVIYIDNRKEVERNIRQKEDVKIILEF